MVTSFSAIEDWVKDNGLTHWIFYSSNPRTKGDNDRTNDKIVDSDFFGESTIEQKLDLTRKYLQAFGRHAYGTGWRKGGTTGGLEIDCELSANSNPAALAIGNNLPYTPAPIDEEKLADKIRKEVRAEYEHQEYERKAKELADERRQFEADKAGVIGAVVSYFKPLLPALNRVAGVDAQGDVEAARIVPHQEPTEVAATEEPGDDDFTQEESDTMYDLMVRFKKVEPDYLRLLESVVKMAESGDAMYSTAKGFLLK